VRTFNALLTYDANNGQTFSREKVSVQFTHGEPHPKDRVVVIYLPRKKNARKEQAIYLSLKMLEKACGLKIERVR
jgi:hypothetical protein